MSITDELRDWAKKNQSHSELFGGLPPKHPFNRFCKVEDLLAIADRIDAEHDSAIKAFGAKIDSDYAKLPVDADGVPIRVGDEVSYIGMTRCERVTWIAYGEDGEHHVNTTGGSYTHPDTLRHHHEPTTEDVLDEFASAYDRIGGSDEEHQKYLDLIAEYAKRLQLRGEDA